MVFGSNCFPYKEKPLVFRSLVVPTDGRRAVCPNIGFCTDPVVLHVQEYRPGHYYGECIRSHTTSSVGKAHRVCRHVRSWCCYIEFSAALDFPFFREFAAREIPYINMVQRGEIILRGSNLSHGKIIPDEVFRFYGEHTPPPGSGLGVPSEEASKQRKWVIEWRLDHCITGKLQIFKALGYRKLHLKERFSLKELYDLFTSLFLLPFYLFRWETLWTRCRN